MTNVNQKMDYVIETRVTIHGSEMIELHGWFAYDDKRESPFEGREI